MTQEEARDALLLGATNTETEYITIQRETLLIALGQEPTIEDTGDGEGL
jgi:hypothetical protein